MFCLSLGRLHDCSLVALNGVCSFGNTRINLYELIVHCVLCNLLTMRILLPPIIKAYGIDQNEI
ncbi:MAG: hypothetical protein WC401_07295, partial [Bacteroidales bacterium]